MARRRWSFWMTPLEHRSIRWLDDQYKGLLTPMGHALLWTTLAADLIQLGGPMPFIERPIPLLIIALGFCTGALIVSFVLGMPFRPRVDLKRHLPPPPTEGDTIQYTVTVTNRGRFTARQLVVQERGLPAELRPVGDPPIIPALAPGQSVDVTLRLLCKTRGAYALGRVQAASTFPSGIWKALRRGPGEATILVYPKLSQLDRFEVPLGQQYQPGGFASASRVGESTEFLGTREWRYGDRVRDVHWPSYARTGQLIVKEFQEEYFVRVALVIDTEATNAKDEGYFEKALSVAAGAANALARHDAIIDLVAAGADVVRFQTGRAISHMESLLEFLACLAPDDSFDDKALETELLPQAAQFSAVVFVVLHWDDARARVVGLLKAHGVAVRVLSVHPDRTPSGLSPDEVVVLS